MVGKAAVAACVLVGAGVGATGAYALLKSQMLPTKLPADLQEILDQYSVKFIVYEGTPQQRTVTIPQINPKYPNVKILSYAPKSQGVTETGEHFDQVDTYVLGVEDLGLQDSVIVYPEERDDWKDLIVSIRRAPTYNQIWVTFQVSYSHAIISKAGVKVYDTKYDGPSTPLKVIAYEA